MSWIYAYGEFGQTHAIVSSGHLVAPLTQLVQRITDVSATNPTSSVSSLPSQSTSSAPSSPPANSDLSSGAKIGIGVGVPLVVIAIIFIVAFVILRRRRQHRRQEALGATGPIELKGEEHKKLAEADSHQVHEVAEGKRPAEIMGTSRLEKPAWNPAELSG